MRERKDKTKPLNTVYIKPCLPPASRKTQCWVIPVSLMFLKYTTPL